MVVHTIWEIWAYDVWGNEEDGWDVNDRTCIDRNCVLDLKVKTYNAGTPRAFEAAAPSNEQITEAFGLPSNIDIDADGDDVTIYVTDADDGYPIGEMLCVSHASLSPIRER